MDKNRLSVSNVMEGMAYSGLRKAQETLGTSWRLQLTNLLTVIALAGFQKTFLWTPYNESQLTKYLWIDSDGSPIVFWFGDGEPNRANAYSLYAGHPLDAYACKLWTQDPQINVAIIKALKEHPHFSKEGFIGSTDFS